MAKSIIDYIPEEKVERFQAIIAAAEEAKANAPRAAVERKPLTPEQKKKMAIDRIAKLEAQLAELEAAEE